jgi:hypothetical protein
MSDHLLLAAVIITFPVLLLIVIVGKNDKLYHLVDISTRWVHVVFIETIERWVMQPMERNQQRQMQKKREEELATLCREQLEMKISAHKRPDRPAR